MLQQKIRGNNKERARNREWNIKKSYCHIRLFII